VPRLTKRKWLITEDPSEWQQINGIMYRHIDMLSKEYDSAYDITLHVSALYSVRSLFVNI